MMPRNNPGGTLRLCLSGLVPVVLIAGASGCGTNGTPAAPVAPPTSPAPAPEPPPETEPAPGPGLDIFDFPMRAISISGYWGTNRDVVQPWEDAGGVGPLIPQEYISWLRGMHANWILISVGLHYDDSMDSTVSRETSRDRNVPTWRDDSLRHVIREFREHGFDVYVTLAFEAHEAEASARPTLADGLLGDPALLRTPAVCRPDEELERQLIRPENWPWRPDHPDHEAVYVPEFWRDLHPAAPSTSPALAEDEGRRSLLPRHRDGPRCFVRAPTLTIRTGPSPGTCSNDFGDELRDHGETASGPSIPAG